MIDFKLPNWLQAAEYPAMRIGIDGLSPLASQLDVGRQYLLAVDNEQAKETLLLSTVRCVIASGRGCAIVSRDPQRLSGQLLAGGLQPNQASLQLFQQLPDTLAHMQSYGCERFLLELEQLGVRSGSLLIVEAADDFFNMQDALQLNAQTQRYRRWFNAWQVAGLFLFTANSTMALQTVFARQLESFTGVGEFRHDLGGYRWRIKHWYCGHGVLEDAEYEVQLNDKDGGLQVVESALDDDISGDISAVYYTAESIVDDESVPDHWVRCPGNQQLLAVGARLSLATVVLDYRQQLSFPLLAQTVHQLRYLAGRKMRIMIRERGSQLRYSQELLLTRLGANQIVYMEFGVSRLLRAVEAAVGQRFTGHIEADFDHALATAMPSEECGYLPAGRFCEVVKSSLQKTAAIEMHHVLVRLDMLPELAHFDVLLNCQPRRANDVVTADESHVYIFLFACRQADIDSALSRIIIEPLEQMFSGQSYWSGRRDILEVLDGLHEQYKLTGMADFSFVLPASRHQVTADSASGAAALISNNSRDSREVANAPVDAATVVRAARTVVQHSLKLRS